MKKAIFFLILFLSMVVYSQASWVQLNSGTSNQLTCVFFINSDSGFVSGYNGTILFTSNGGNNWLSRSVNTTASVSNIHFINNSTGFGVYDHYFIKTTNAGINWIITENSNTLGIYDIHFPVPNTGYTCGDMGHIYKTTDMGNSWIFASQLYFQNTTTSIFFCNALTGYSIQGNCTFKTVNGGLNWTYCLYVGGVAIQFLNDSIGYSCGTAVRKSTNGGTNWTDLTIASSSFTNLFFLNSNTGFATGFPADCRKTTDGGATWVTMAIPVSTYINSVSFVNALTGYMCGINGVILKTTMGGINPVKTISTNVPDEFKLYQNYPNPFNPKTKIKFSLPLPSKVGVLDVRLMVFDILGREVASLIPPLWGGKEGLQPGKYEVEWDGTNYPSGIYYYQLTAAEFTETKRMVLLK